MAVKKLSVLEENQKKTTTELATSISSAGDEAVKEELTASITALSTKVDNAIASISQYSKNYIKGNFTKTLLTGGTDKSNWNGAGTLTLTQPYTNFDAIVVIPTADSSTSFIGINIYFKWELDLLYDLAISSSKEGINIFNHYNYWSVKPSTFKTTSWAIYTENSGIQAIYGITIPD